MTIPINNISHSTEPAVLYVVEIGSTPFPPAAQKIIFATQCYGVRVNDELYVAQTSISDLLKDDEILVVAVKDCVIGSGKKTGTFAEFTFNTEVDQHPHKNKALHIKKQSEIPEEILAMVRQWVLLR